MALAAAARGSDKWPEKPTFCGFPTADQERKKNVLTGETGGGRVIRTVGADLHRGFRLVTAAAGTVDGCKADFEPAPSVYLALTVLPSRYRRNSVAAPGVSQPGTPAWPGSWHGPWPRACSTGRRRCARGRGTRPGEIMHEGGVDRGAEGEVAEVMPAAASGRDLVFDRARLLLGDLGGEQASLGRGGPRRGHPR
jgi:hypothetical protein